MENNHQDLNSYYNFYGCYLNGVTWECSKFATIDEADDYCGIMGHPKGVPSKLIPINKYTPELLDRVFVKKRLQLPINITKI